MGCGALMNFLPSLLFTLCHEIGTHFVATKSREQASRGGEGGQAVRSLSWTSFVLSSHYCYPELADERRVPMDFPLL
ncbi:hypothetical protein GGR56DRAFT_635930 [Xylariaceae sp. FL0804]|nr:hypothetical protein GGR56DRAFT_635930 [Xylariaceae sp. FL0804]